MQVSPQCHSFGEVDGLRLRGLLEAQREGEGWLSRWGAEEV